MIELQVELHSWKEFCRNYHIMALCIEILD